MKNRLIILSLCPLFILTFIQYFPWTKINVIIRNIDNIDMYKTHVWLCLGLVICIVWFACSVGIYLKFKFNMKYDRTEGYESGEIVEERDAGLNFFLALILPLLINDISQLNGLLMLMLHAELRFMRA